MNRRQEFDDLMRDWADLGDERLETRYLDAALAQIESTPQRGVGWRPLQEILMRLKPVAPILGVVAAVVLAIAAYQLLSDQNIGSPSQTPAAPAPSYPLVATRTAEGYSLFLEDAETRGDGGVEVTVLDPDGVLVTVAGAWLDAEEDIGTGAATGSNPPHRPDILEIRWAGACADRIVISVERMDGVAISLDDRPSGSAAGTCRPRGFIHLLAALRFSEAVPSDVAEVTDLRPGYRDVP
jgi:hypothetical protein